MDALILYGSKDDKNTVKELITAKYTGVSLKLQQADVSSSDYLNKNPFGKPPLLETSEGCIFESNAIARFLARIGNQDLLGLTLKEQGHIEMWIELSSSEIDGPLSSWYEGRKGTLQYDSKIEQAAIQQLESVLTVLDNIFSQTTFLVGDRITLADIILTSTLLNGFTQLFDAQFRQKIPKLQRYFLTVVNQPFFREVLGDITLCEKPLEAPKGAQKAKGAGAAAVQQQPKKEKVQQQPKQAKPVQQQALPQTTAAEEEEKPKEVKAKNPLDLLPPSKMVLDAWKRLYSNSPASRFRQVAINGLWNGGDVPNSPNQEHFEGFDPEGFSIWTLEYKYPEENTVNFIVMNKVGGFFQRIDYARKYIFGVCCILKDTNKGYFPIRGFFIFRGQDIPPMIQENCPDLELYEWKKLDLSDKKGIARIEDMLCEEATIDGLEHIECKVFK